MRVEHLAEGVSLLCGDCMELLPTLDSNSIDSFVSDPPYHLTSIVKRFGADNSAPAKDYSGVKAGATGAYARASAGFMGKKWDGGDIAFNPELWREVFRVLKPGAHLLAFGGTRTYHRMACAIEDAGFEVRDCVQWLYGSGFPKSHDISKAIDKAVGTEREIIGRYSEPNGRLRRIDLEHKTWAGTLPDGEKKRSITAPATDAAREWQGYGTALKPACEIICLARKPLSEKTVAANVVRWGTGALNIDGCRVATDPSVDDARLGGKGEWHIKREQTKDTVSLPPASMGSSPFGRWPANVITDGSDEVVGMFPDADGLVGMQRVSGQKSIYQSGISQTEKQEFSHGVKDSGSAARFFYTSKADSDDRLGSKHPTVKPVDLMQYLVRLITPKNGLCLDCFAGTGTTGEAAWREGMRAVLIEREVEYQEDIRRRAKLFLAGPVERKHVSIKARGKPVDHGPLFDDYDSHKDVEGCFTEAYRAVRERVAAGGKGWEPK